MYKLNTIKNKLFFSTRYLSSPCRKLPSFLIIGEAKCGTTSLFNYIVKNKMVIAPFKKEIHFFDYKYNKGINWYKSHFPLKKIGSNFITGEATPYYFSHPKAYFRVKERLPNSKIILILRNPVDRALSSFYNQKRNGLENVGTFQEAIKLEKSRLLNKTEEIFTLNDFNYNHKYYSYLERGKYVENLKRWLVHFNLDNILVLEFESFFSNIASNYQNVIKFLEIAEQKVEDKKYNVGKYSAITSQLRTRLLDYYYPYNEELYKLLGIRYHWNN